MKRLRAYLFVWSWLLVALLDCTGCARESGDPGNPVLMRKAASLTDSLAHKDWKALRRDFNSTMRLGLSEAGLAAAWRQSTVRLGGYKSRGETRAVAKPGGATAFDTPMVFQRGEMKSRFSFDSDGKVSGLFLLDPDDP
jgi:hypothetical protein